MKISTKSQKLTRILGTAFGLISVPVLSTLVFLNAAHAEGDDIVCNQSPTPVSVVLRAQNDSGQITYGRGAVRSGTCQTIFWRGARGLQGNVTEWIQVADYKGPISPDRYVDGVNQSQTAGAWILMRTGHIVVK